MCLRRGTDTRSDVIEGDIRRQVRKRFTLGTGSCTEKEVLGENTFIQKINH